MRKIERRVEAGRPKRRYRRRKFRKALKFLRPVTNEILHAYSMRVPDRTDAEHEIVCFAIDPGDKGDERLAIVAFGYDKICRVVDLGYRAGDGDVERLPHRIDLQKLKGSIAHRARRGRFVAANELALQLLIRFIVDLNPLLSEGDAGGGAFLSFREGWKVLNLVSPTTATRERIKRRLEMVAWSDPAIPGNQTYRVHIHADRDQAFAEQEQLHRWLVERSGSMPENESLFWSDDLSLLTERFVALAWHILEAENNDSTLLSTDWDNHGDRCRSGGFSAEVESWHIQIDRPSEGRRARAGKRLRKLLKILLRSAQRHLASKARDVEWAQESLAKDIRRQKALLPWARVRWLDTNPGLVTDIANALEERAASGRYYAALTAKDAVEARRGVDRLRRELGLKPSGSIDGGKRSPRQADLPLST